MLGDPPRSRRPLTPRWSSLFYCTVFLLRKTEEVSGKRDRRDT